MPKPPRWNANDAHRELNAAGFTLLRTKESHRIYSLGEGRVVVSFHGSRELHPKIVRQVLDAVSECGGNPPLMDKSSYELETETILSQFAGVVPVVCLLL